MTLFSRLVPAVLIVALPIFARAADPKPAETAVLIRLHKMDASATKDAAGNVIFVQFGCGSHLRDDDVILLSAFPNLERLIIIGYDDITDAGVEHLRGLKVKKLMLVSDKLTVKSAEHLATLKDLESLDLKSAPVTGEWLKQLKTLPNLHTLKLRGAELTDADAQEFASFPKLESLQIRSSKMTNAGTESVKAALPKVNITQ